MFSRAWRTFLPNIIALLIYSSSDVCPALNGHFPPYFWMIQSEKSVNFSLKFVKKHSRLLQRKQNPGRKAKNRKKRNQEERYVLKNDLWRIDKLDCVDRPWLLMTRCNKWTIGLIIHTLTEMVLWKRLVTR